MGDSSFIFFKLVPMELALLVGLFTLRANLNFLVTVYEIDSILNNFSACVKHLPCFA